jgi:short-subunit dehydrogenase
VLIADNIFIVTGASSGIGRATACALADRGGRVALVARRADRLREVADLLGPIAIAIPVDITTAGAPDLIYEATTDAFGRVDGLINCAGRGLAGRIVDLDVDVVDESFELNFVAPLRLIQAIAPHLVAQKSGAIGNVSSPVATLGLPGIAGYATAKAALSALSIALRRELIPSGVRVSLVYPGVTDSEYYDTLMGDETARTEPRPPAQPPERVARGIVRAIERGEREVWCLSPKESRGLRIMGAMARVMPGALDRGLANR